MPTLLLTYECMICGEAIMRHGPSEADKCRKLIHERVHGRGKLNDQSRWLHAMELTKLEPARIGTQCCWICRCFLPGLWGTVTMNDGKRICGQCARDSDPMMEKEIE